MTLDQKTAAVAEDSAFAPQFMPEHLLAVDVTPVGAGDTVVVSPAGEVDAFTAPLLRAALSDCLQPPCTGIILDLTAVTFLNSAALAVLAEAHRLAQIEHIVLTLGGNPPRAVRRPLELTGLWELLAPPPH